MINLNIGNMKTNSIQRIEFLYLFSCLKIKCQKYEKTNTKPTSPL